MLSPHSSWFGKCWFIRTSRNTSNTTTIHHITNIIHQNCENSCVVVVYFEHHLKFMTAENKATDIKSGWVLLVHCTLYIVHYTSLCTQKLIIIISQSWIVLLCDQFQFIRLIQKHNSSLFEMSCSPFRIHVRVCRKNNILHFRVMDKSKIETQWNRSPSILVCISWIRRLLFWKQNPSAAYDNNNYWVGFITSVSVSLK